MFGIVLQSFSKNDLKRAYDQYFESLRAFLYYKTFDKELSEDLVQEVFIKVWEKRKEIRKETLKSLLYTIANNLLINHVNHLKVVQSHANEINEAASINSQSPQFLYEEKEFERLFNDIIEKLPDGVREVFLMSRLEKMSYQKIADRLELSVKAIEKRMSKAIATIKDELGVKV